MPYLWGKPSQASLRLPIPIVLYSGPASENEEWSSSSELSAVFQSSQGHGCRGPPHPDLRGQIILILPIPLTQHAGGWGWDTSVVIKSQALGNGRKPNSSILHLLGDKAAHRYTVVKRTRDSPPPLITWGQGDLVTFFASNNSIVFEGWGDRMRKNRVLPLTDMTRKHPPSQMLCLHVCRH